MHRLRRDQEALLGFRKFPQGTPNRGSQITAVGEIMAIGCIFRESLMKGLQSSELDQPAFPTHECNSWDQNLESISIPTDNRILKVWEALRAGKAIKKVTAISGSQLSWPKSFSWRGFIFKCNVEIIEGKAMVDHCHLVVLIAPKIRVSGYGCI
jgi:hypothetical protein